MSPHGDEALQLGSKSKKNNYNFPGRQAINIKNKQPPKQNKTKNLEVRICQRPVLKLRLVSHLLSSIIFKIHSIRNTLKN